jgi:hypothetical protein
MALNEQQTQAYIDGWNELRESDYRNDFEKASFLRTLRRRFPADASGTLQFKTFINRNLRDITGSNALDYCKLLGSFRTERVWSALGGFRTLRHLLNLPTATARRRVKVAALARADRDGQPVTYGIVRNIALNMGYRSTVQGRPTQTTMERKRDVLAQFIYDNVTGEIPTEVVEAMPHRLQVQYS